MFKRIEAPPGLLWLTALRKCGQEAGCCGRLPVPPTKLPKDSYIIEDNMHLGIHKYVYYKGSRGSQDRNLKLMTNRNYAEKMNLLGCPELSEIYNTPDQSVRRMALEYCIRYSKRFGYMTTDICDPTEVSFEKSSVGLLCRGIWKDKKDMAMDPQFMKYFLLFWKYARFCNWIDPYTLCNKQELLEKTKHDKHGGRTFCYCGPYQYFHDALLFQNSNRSIELSSICYSGFNPFYGHSKRLVSSMRKRFRNFYLVRGDAKKYDYTQTLQDVEDDEEWVLSCWMGSEFFHSHISYAYKRMKEKHYVNFDRHVIDCSDYLEYWSFMVSGGLITSSGNSRRHFRTLITYFYYLGIEPDEGLHHVVPFICSDDHLYLVDADWKNSARFVDYDNRSYYYAKQGIVLKKDDDFVTYNTVEGMRFMGLLLHDNGLNHFDSGKMLESAGFKLDLDHDAYCAKLNSLLLLIVNTEQFHDLFTYCNKLDSNYPWHVYEDALDFFNGTA